MLCNVWLSARWFNVSILGIFNRLCASHLRAPTAHIPCYNVSTTFESLLHKKKMQSSTSTSSPQGPRSANDPSSLSCIRMQKKSGGKLSGSSHGYVTCRPQPLSPSEGEDVAFPPTYLEEYAHIALERPMLRVEGSTSTEEKGRKKLTRTKKASLTEGIKVCGASGFEECSGLLTWFNRVGVIEEE